MADKKLDTVLPKLLPLLRVLGSGTDGEVVNTVGAMRRVLAKAGLDIHAVADRVASPPFDETEAEQIYKAGYDQRIADEAEEKRAPKPFFSTSTPPSYSFGINDDIGDGVNGYGWKDIIVFCRTHVDRIPPGKSHNFAESIFRQLMGGHDVPTPKQAPWLRDIFVQYFGGKIV